jgi:hypothetical protein
MESEFLYSAAERNFILQQGFENAPPETCHPRYSALLFQPRIVGLTVLIGVILQSPIVFLILWAILWWSALLPAWNPFDALYNRLKGAWGGEIRLTPAPGPRRFAQGLAGTFALAIGLSLLVEWRIVANIFEGLFLVAIVALVFGRFCLGSFLYHLLRGRGDFARRTLPWIAD